MTLFLITGATGNVGSVVAAQLQGMRQPIRTTMSSLRADAVPEAVVLDFENPATYPAALENVSTIFLMRPPSMADTKHTLVPFIAAAKEAGVEHIVFLSLLGAESNRFVPHYAVERALETSGLAWTFLRASFFMQNLSTTNRADIHELHEIVVPAGDGLTSFIDCRDIASVAVTAMTLRGYRNKALDITGNEALDYTTVARLLSDELQQQITYANPSIAQYILHMHQRGYKTGFILVTTAIYQTARFGLAGKVTSKTGTILGREPISMRQFIQDYRKVWI